MVETRETTILKLCNDLEEGLKKAGVDFYRIQPNGAGQETITIKGAAYENNIDDIHVNYYLDKKTCDLFSDDLDEAIIENYSLDNVETLVGFIKSHIEDLDVFSSN